MNPFLIQKAITSITTPIYLVGFIFFASCVENPKLEEPLISQDRMVPVLVDMHLAEAHLQTLSAEINRDSLADVYYAYIYQIHRITGEELDQSMKAYLSNPKETQALFTKVEKVVQGLKEGKEKKTAPDQNKNQNSQ